MSDLPEILEHAVLEPGEWLVLRIDPTLASREGFDALMEQVPDDLHGRVLVVTGEFAVLRPTGGAS